MSNYTIEISGNQPYYVQVDNSSLQSPINLDIIKNNDINVEVSTSNTFLAFNAPSGYPVDNLLNVETVVRTSSDQSINGVKTFNNDVVLSGNLIAKSQPTAITPTYFPVFISDPSALSRQVYTRTPSQIKSDLTLNNVQNIALSGVNFSAGSGLVGGGNLSSSTSFHVGVGDGISVAADAISVDSTVVRASNIDQSISGIKSFINTSGTRFTTGGSSSKDIIFRPVSGIISNNTITISPITNLVNNRTYYLPEAGADADFVMTAGGQVITGPKTFTSPAIFNSGTFTSLRVGVTGVALSGHIHIVSDVTGLQAALDSKQPSGNYVTGSHTHTSSSITDFNTAVDSRITNANLQPSGNYSVVGHTHIISNITGLQTALDNKQASGNYSLAGHTHNIADITSLQTTLDNKQPSGSYALSSHTHTSSNITDFNTSVDSRIVNANLQPSGNYSSVGHTHAISDITSLQTTLDGKQASGNYAISSHTHTSSNITDFNTSVSGLLPVKNVTGTGYVNISSTTGNYTVSVIGLQPSGSYASSSHTHTSSDITNFNTSVSGLVNGIYAPLNSPSFSGVPLTPTAASGTNNTQIASTAFVRTEISNLVASAPAALDTLNELATALGNDANFSTTVTNNLAGKANLSGATFTGSVSGPSGNFTSLKVNSVDVSANGHTHTSSNITDFNSSVSGLLPVKNISNGSYISVSSISGNYTISTTGLQPSGNYSLSNHTHSSFSDLNLGSSNLDTYLNINVPSSYETTQYQDASIFKIDNGDLAATVFAINGLGHITYGTIDSTNVNGLNDAITARIPTTIVYTSGNQDISGVKTFNNNVNISGLLTSVSGNFTNSLKINGTDVSISGHTHSISNVTDLQTALNNKQPSGNYALSSHSHTSSNITDFNSSVSGLISVKNITAGNYINVSSTTGNYTVAVTGLQPSGNYSLVGHTHAISDITSLQTALDGKQPSGNYAASSHTHTASQITDFNTSVDSRITSANLQPSGNYSLVGHNHTSSNITDFNSSVSGLLTPYQLTLTNPVTGTGTTSYVPKWISTSSVGNSLIFDNGTSVGINTNTPSSAARLEVNGAIQQTWSSSRFGMFYDNTYRMGINYNASSRIMQIFSTSSDSNGHITFSTRIGAGSSDTDYGTERMRITNLGYVGIGTTTPSTQLHVIGSGLFSSGIRVGDSSTNGYIYGPSGNANIQINNAGTNRIDVTATNLYLGAITYLNGATTYANGTLIFPKTATPTSIASQSNPNEFRFYNGLWNGSSAYDGYNTLHSIASTSVSGASRFAVLMNNGDGTQNRTERLSILSNGNLGIGTTTPSTQLHVIGSGLFSGDVITSGSFIGGSGTAALPSFEFVNDTDTGLFSPVANTFAISTSGVERLRVNNLGNIGIGYSSPTTTLQVNGSFSCGSSSDPSSGGQGLYVDPATPLLRVIDSGPNYVADIDVNGLTLYDAASTPFFFTDRTNTRIGIGTNAPGSTLDITGDVNVDGNLTFDSYTESVVSNGNSGTSKTLSLTNGTVHTCTLTGNCTFTMPTATAGKSFSLFLNSGSGNYTATFTGVRWSDSTAPTITSTASKVDLLSFISDGSFWYGSFSQNYG